MKHRVNIF